VLPTQIQRAAGLHAGLSGSGVDVAILEFSGEEFSVIAWRGIDYTMAMRRKVQSLYRPGVNGVDDISLMNFVLGEVFAESLAEVCDRASIPLSSIDIVGSSGQVLHHQPTPKRFRGQPIRSQLVIGESAVIAQRTGIPTVSDFSARDIAAQGQGRPITAIIDHMLFRRKKVPVALQQISAVTTVTFLPPEGDLDGLRAFDTGPGTVFLDEVVRRSTSGTREMDEDGGMAQKGKVHEGMVKMWLSNPFLRRQPPRSAGPETFGPAYADEFCKDASKRGLKPQDVVATATGLVAASIAQAYRRFLPVWPEMVLVAGGGTRNPKLMEMIHRRMPGTEIQSVGDLGIAPEAKQAVCYALLARETIWVRPNNVPSATGASRRVVMGKIDLGSDVL
jgi:anhydro-N-acetylmuramic acid kinase